MKHALCFFIILSNSHHPRIMKLSVIIVNYNVEHFLEQCLHAVHKASINLATEVIVVDNNSVDNSLKMLQEKFPEVHVIANTKNTGFAYANNQAINSSKGEYVLLLNPDTIVEEDTFEKVLMFMDAHPEGGGLGVKMLDGKGNFLPESKRGLPTPMVAFYKIFGFSRLFPKSKTFGKYHLGFLSKDQIHEVDILSGAFMLLRKSALDKVGLLDEAFFMYGEDIDLSYRLVQGGYKNYYFPETRIIHYKGESTKKSSVNYVFVFYNAMQIFARKHFSQKNARTFSFFINIAIYLRAAAAIISRFAQKIILPFIDAIMLFGGIYGIKNYYEHYIKFSDGGSYPQEFITIVVPAYIAVWLTTVFLSGGYDKPVKLTKIIRGLFVGTGIILMFYALLPEHYRFSRALILLGAVWSIASMLSVRMFLHLIKLKNFTLDGGRNKRVAIIGSAEECERVHTLLKQTSLPTGFVGYVSHLNEPENKKNNFIGSLHQLREIASIYKIDEAIFCAKDLSAQNIIDQMLLFGTSDVDFKIAPPESLAVIGSNSIDTSGDLYVIDINSITKSVNRRNKRLLDIVTSLTFLMISPLLLFFIQHPVGFFGNIFRVLSGKKSWIGYSYNEENAEYAQKLPVIRKGVLHPADILNGRGTNPITIKNLNILYAKDYKVYTDLSIIRKGFKYLGRS